MGTPWLWLLRGNVYAGDVNTKYAHNGLDVLCQHRHPVDVVLIDTSSSDLEAIWMIIEFVCRPRWIILANINLQGRAGWIHHRLLLRSEWRLEVLGHYSLSAERWSAFRELRRQRAWSIFRRASPPSDVNKK